MDDPHVGAGAEPRRGERAALYAGIGGSGGQVMAWNLTGKSLWTAQTDGNVEAVTVANGEVIAGGHYQNFCDLGTNCQTPLCASTSRR